MKIAEPDRAGDDAEKAAVFTGDTPAQDDGIGAAMQHRAADEQALVRIVAVSQKILLVAAVFRPRVERGGVDRQLAARIEHLDRAKMLGGGGVVEQDQMQDRLADVLELGHQHVVGDRAQRQVVNLDIAADIGVDAGGKVFQHLPRQLLLAAAHVEHDGSANGGEADHRRHRRGDQQLGRQSPVPPGRMFPPLE